jgi:hypothetical protein
VRSRLTLLLCAVVLCPLAAVAGQITVVSYSMFNGGTATFDYRDTSYLPCPSNNCNTTGAALSGGTGELTDGVSPTADWNLGPPEGWVGWANNLTNGLNPIVTFFFSGMPTINSVTVWFDNTLNVGLVSAPSSISVDGTSYNSIPQGISGPQAFTINGLNITGSSIEMQFFQTDEWIMIGEVTFNGTKAPPVPEPGTLVLFGSGLISVLSLKRRKMAQTADQSALLK